MSIFLRTSRSLALVTIAFGAAALFGWIADIPLLRSLIAGKTAMNPATALGFLALGCGLLSLTSRRFPAARVAAAIAGVFGFARLLVFTGMDPALDTVFFSGSLDGNRMAPNTAFCMALAAIALGLSTSLRLARRAWADPANVLVLIIAFMTLAGYAYRADALYEMSTYMPMALTTGAAFFCFSLGLFLARWNEGVAGVFSSRDLGGTVARRLLPIVAVTPLGLGALRIYGQGAGWYQMEFGVALQNILTVGILVFLTWRCAKYLGELDRAFKKQTRLMESILSSIGDGVIVTTNNEAMTLYNQPANDLLNLELYGRDPAGWTDSVRMARADGTTDRDGEGISLSHALAAGEDGTSEFRIGGANGRYLSITGRPVVDGDVKLGQVAVVRDITAQKKELHQIRSQVEQLQKLDAIGRLAGGMAHDFNNILGAIQMYCDMLPKQMDRPKLVVDGIGQIQKATERGAALTRQLLVFSRKRAVEKHPIQLNELLQDHFKMTSRLLTENIEVDFKLSSDLPILHADSGQIEQVMMNLVINARDAMAEKGGRLTIETRYVELNEEFAQTHLASKLGPHILISVADTGTGMDEETRARIFEPFFTTKGVGKGTGMGLSMVYGIVKSLEGTIWVYSEPGRGSVFKIYLPCARGAAMPVAAASKIVANLEGTETILVVEDETQLRELFGESLMQYGYTILLAENGKAALELVRDAARPIDLIVTDMIMPELGGGELVRSVLSSNNHARVLCISGYTEANVGYRELENERVAYLEKPFNTVTLLTHIRALLDAKNLKKSA